MLEGSGVDFLRRAFQARRVDEPASRAAPQGVSAVLIAVYDVPGAGPSLLYTQRASTLRRHPGEVSFPGGRVDPSDAHPMAAALREAEEEVGLPPAEVEVLGHLTDYLTFHDVLVCAYVGHVKGTPPLEPRSRDEVARIFTVPVRTLLSPERYESRRMAVMPRERRVHYWHVEPQTVWGVTGELTARFLEAAYGWQPPGEARLIASPHEFRPAP